MASTKILICITEEQKAAYTARAKELGLSVSAWLKGFADNDCDPATTVVPKAATPVAPKAPKVATKVIQKAGIDIVVPTKSAGRQCGHMYCKAQRAKGQVGNCFL